MARGFSALDRAFLRARKNSRSEVDVLGIESKTGPRSAFTAPTQSIDNREAPFLEGNVLVF